MIAKIIYNKFVFCALIIILLIGAVFASVEKSQALSVGQVDATVRITVCGNNTVETGESCDNSDLNGRSCVSLGYKSGTLACRADCSFNTSDCSSDDGGGGGGGGGGGLPDLILNNINLSGRAYPLSKVTVLKDGQEVITTIAGPDAKFSVSLSGISPGNYSFSVLGTDNLGNRSALFTFSVSVTSGATTNISGVFIPPTITVDKQEVKRGENLTLFGRSAPNSKITIQVNSSDPLFFGTNADKDGAYLYKLDTTPLENGDHQASSKAKVENDVSPFSGAVIFKVGGKTVLKEVNKIFKGDTNSDNKINLVDFSIMAYWYKRPMPPSKVDLNGDGKVDLVDFSILAYYWTG